MKSIYACKLYKSSTRKEKIEAALADPVNAELVEQIASYLDEEYQIPIKKKVPQRDVKDTKDDPSIQTGDAAPAAKTNSARLSNSSDDVSRLEGEKAERGDHEGDDPDATPVDIEESINVSQSSVTASSDCIDLSNDVDEIKGMLNLRDDTHGVSRVRVKSNELWIYYEDSINLNNIMTKVIDVLISSGYSYLEFNRLARSENAVVFEISRIDTCISNSTIDTKEG